MNNNCQEYNFSMESLLLHCSNAAVNPKPDHSPGRPPRDSHLPTAQGVRVWPDFLCPRDQSFELERLSTVLKEKCRKFSMSVSKKPWRKFKKQVFLCCFISIFANTCIVDVYCIFNNMDHF